MKPAPVAKKMLVVHRTMNMFEWNKKNKKKFLCWPLVMDPESPVMQEIKMKKFFVFMASGGILKDFILIASRKIKKVFLEKLKKVFGKTDEGELQSYIIRVEKVWNFLETEQPKNSLQVRRVKSPFTQGQGG